MDQLVPLGVKVGLGPGHIVLHGDTAHFQKGHSLPRPPKRGTSPNFRPMSIVTRRSPISAAAELLLNSLYSITVLFWFHAVN